MTKIPVEVETFKRRSNMYISEVINFSEFLNLDPERQEIRRKAIEILTSKMEKLDEARTLEDVKENFRAKKIIESNRGGGF